MLSLIYALDGCLHWSAGAVLGGILAGAIVGLYAVFVRLVECNRLLRRLLFLAEHREPNND